MSTIGLVSPGRLQSLAGGGGGSSPLGVATIWNTSNQEVMAYPTWADLADIPDPRDEDEALVLNIDGTGSLGYARYSEADEEWGLYLAEFSSLTAMHEFGELIRNNCTATIPTGRLYKSKSVTGPNAIVKRIWVWDGVEASIATFPAFLDGTEADTAARLLHGFVDVPGVGTSITGNVGGTGYTRLAAPAGGTQNTQLTTLTGAITAATKLYVKFRIKSSTSGAVGAGSIIGIYIADGSNIAYPRQAGVSQPFGYQNAANSIISSGALRSGGATLPVGDTWVEIIDEGRTVLTTIVRDGVIYHSEKRSSVASGSNVLGFLMGTQSSPGAAFVDVRDFIVLTYT